MQPRGARELLLGVWPRAGDARQGDQLTVLAHELHRRLHQGQRRVALRAGVDHQRRGAIGCLELQGGVTGHLPLLQEQRAASGLLAGLVREQVHLVGLRERVRFEPLLGLFDGPRRIPEVARVGGNITDLTTRLAGELYVLLAEVDLPVGVDAVALTASLGAVAERLGVEVSLRAMESDDL